MENDKAIESQKVKWRAEKKHDGTEIQGLDAINAMLVRIDTTKRTDPEQFELAQKYIRAASIFTEYCDLGSDKRIETLKCQMLALELAKEIPHMLKKIQREINALEK